MDKPTTLDLVLAAVIILAVAVALVAMLSNPTPESSGLPVMVILMFIIVNESRKRR